MLSPARPSRGFAGSWNSTAVPAVSSFLPPTRARSSLRSAPRCLPLFFAPLPSRVLIARFSAIRKREEQGTRFTCTNDDLELIAEAAQGDMRRGILMLQAAYQAGSCNNLVKMSQSETGTVAGSAISLIKEGDLKGGIRQL